MRYNTNFFTSETLYICSASNKPFPPKKIHTFRHTVQCFPTYFRGENLLLDYSRNSLEVPVKLPDETFQQ
jgi:hypothetical protein